MLIRLTKRSDTCHYLECRRADGSVEAAELETRSFLAHDLLHFAVESEAGLTRSFWGSVAAGYTFAELVGKDESKGANFPKNEIGVTEMVVGALSGILQEPSNPDASLEGLRRLFDANELPLPSYLDAAFIGRVAERMRRLWGEWRSVPYGGTMELVWEPDSLSR